MTEPSPPKRPARPPTQAVFPGRRRPAPHLRHEQAMKRPNETVTTAKHILHPHREK